MVCWACCCTPRSCYRPTIAAVIDGWSRQFVTDVMKPLKIEDIMDQEVQNLSGGELQRVAIVLCLGKPADVYLIDEPSAYLDSEQRLVAAKVIKRSAGAARPAIEQQGSTLFR